MTSDLGLRTYLPRHPSLLFSPSRPARRNGRRGIRLGAKHPPVNPVPPSSLAGAVLSAMINPQDFDDLVPQAIDGDMGQGRKRKLPRSFLTSDAATVRPLLQGLNGRIDFAQGRLPVMGMVVSQVVTINGDWGLGSGDWGRTRNPQIGALPRLTPDT